MLRRISYKNSAMKICQETNWFFHFCQFACIFVNFCPFSSFLVLTLILFLQQADLSIFVYFRPFSSIFVHFRQFLYLPWSCLYAIPGSFVRIFCPVFPRRKYIARKFCQSHHFRRTYRPLVLHFHPWQTNDSYLKCMMKKGGGVRERNQDELKVNKLFDLSIYKIL